MEMSKYCKQKGMTLKEYKQFETNIKNTALAIYQTALTLHKADTGIYYPVTEIISFLSDIDVKCFIIQALKALNMEFYDNSTLYRV